MYLLIPGRHHLLTDFQFKYLYTLINAGLEQALDDTGTTLNIESPIQGIIFAITSANHQGTKRNPIPFYIRSMMVQEFSKELPVPCYIYGINDVGHIDDFANYTIKQIRHQSDYHLDINPQNTLIVCSTPVLDMYKNEGYTILPAELDTSAALSYKEHLPWFWVEQIGNSGQWKKDLDIVKHIHPASLKIWKTYQLGQKVNKILNDPILGSDGDITSSRDYNSYVRQMDEIAELKYQETAQFIQGGNIGDIGCAVGSWIKLASDDPKFMESDFYGIEVSRHLFELCQQRKRNGEFANPNVFFAQKNAVTELVFQSESMNTIFTSSLTHEIASYGSIDALLQFISNRHTELCMGGVWINRDVIGPSHPHKEVYLLLNKKDGLNEDFEQNFSGNSDLSSYLGNLSTFTRFKRFARDFRSKEKDNIAYSFEVINNIEYVKISLSDACEFMLTKDYTDNWESEMHERFCFWSFEDWLWALNEIGFEVMPGSGSYTNPWIEKKRFLNKATLFEKVNSRLIELPSPPTNALMVARKKRNI